MDPITVCNSVKEFNELLCNRRSSEGAMRIDSMYNSYVNRILVGSDAALFTVPIDDHVIVRGHAVFDTATIVKGNLYRHRVHIDRLFESAEKAGLDLSFLVDQSEENDVERQKEQIEDIEIQVARAGGVRNGMIRMWLTAGPGNLGVTKAGCRTTLYMICYGGNPFNTFGAQGDSNQQVLASKIPGVKEWTISEKVPMKEKVLATMKSSNYLMNALGATDATKSGGKFGIWVDPVTDEVYEASVRNVVFVLQNDVLITPPYMDGRILKGCTVRRVVELAKKQLLDNEGNGDVILKEVVTDQVVYKRELLKIGIKEMFLVSGDTHLDPVVQWDDLQIGDGKPGLVFQRIAQMIIDEAMDGSSPHHKKIEY